MGKWKDFFVIASFGVGIGMSIAWQSSAFAVDVGEPLPEIAVNHFSATASNKLDAKTQLNNAALQGKITVINFWATWCEACKVELVEMEKLFKPYMQNKNFQLDFVALDKEPQKAADWLQSNLKDPAPFVQDLYVDPEFKSADKLGIDAFPMTVVLDRSGKIKHIQRGFKEGEGSTAEIAKVAAELLGGGAKTM